MRKVLLLLGIAVLLAAGVALTLLFGRSGDGGRSGERIAAVARPAEPAASPARTDLARPGSQDAETDGPERIQARVARKTTPGAEPVVPVLAAAEAELYGTVLGIYGVPVAGAEVKVEAIGDTADGLFQVLGGTTNKTAVTGPDGRFRVPRPSRWEEVRVTITARGFLAFDRSQDLLEAQGDQDLGVFEIDAGVVLAGRVLDAGGDPVAGATVYRTDPSERDSFRFRGFRGGRNDVQTDAEGRFELLHEEPGAYLLVVRHDAHPDGRFPGVTPPPGSEDRSLVLRLARGASISGRIADFPFGREHVTVAAEVVERDAGANESGFGAMLAESGLSPDGLQGDVEKTGAFRVEGLEAGKTYRLRAFTRAGFFGRVAVSEERTARAGDQEVELTWDPGGKVVARVVDEATAGVVEDVEVRYRWDDQGDAPDFRNQTRRRAFAGGRVEIEELRPAAGQKTLSLLFTAPGYLDLRHDGVAVTEDDEVDIGTVRMRRAPTVRLRVVGPDGDGVLRARVRLAPEESAEEEGSSGKGRGPSGWFSLEKQAATGKTDSDGVVELPAPATATARLEVAHARYAGYLREGVPMPAQGREEVVRLFAGGTIEVAVSDARGNPVPDMRVEHRYPEGALEDEQATHEANKRGEVRLRNQLPGTHRFRASERSGAVEGGDREWKDVVVVDGRTARVVLEVAARATLAGKITEAGVPLERGTVSLLNPESGQDDGLVVEFSVQMGRYSPRGFDSSDRTDRLGRYSLEKVPAGEYRLSVTHADRAAAHVVAVTVRGGENRLDVDLPVTSVEGRVIDTSGAPVEGATLRLVPVKETRSEEGELQRRAFEEFFGGGRSDARSGPDGGYRLRGVPADKPFLVEASHDAHVAARSKEIDVSTGQARRNVDVTLTAGGTLRVRVAGESGPFTFLRARWAGDEEDAPSPKLTMVRRGEAHFGGLRPGPWRITQGDEGEGTVFQVVSGAEAAVDFVP